MANLVDTPDAVRSAGLTETPAPVPTMSTDRSPAPDVARGLVLLGIALANVPVWLTTPDRGILSKPAGDGVDALVNAIVSMTADSRSFPLFALLFAYGMTQILSREQRRGVDWRGARGLLIRRNLWVIAFGAVHGVLLFSGDIMGVYGLLGLLLVVLIRCSGRVLAIIGWIAFGILTVTGAVLGLGGVLAELGIPFDSALGSSMSAQSYLQSTVDRSLEWGLTLISAPFVLLGFLAPMTLGIWAGRYRVLENPEPHRRRLVLVASVGIPVSLLGALPTALVLVGALQTSVWIHPILTMLHAATGAMGAVGYLALITLMVGRRTPGRMGRMLAALGQRSLSGYLLQSVAFLVIFPAYTLGLGGTVGAATASLIAVSTWLATLGLAAVLAAHNKPGPAEWLLRRLVYHSRRRQPAS